MAARTDAAARRLSSIYNFVFIYLAILLVFTRNTRANRTYSRYILLDIQQSCKNSVLDHPFSFDQIPPELIRQARPEEQLIPSGNAHRRRRDRKQKRCKHGGVRVRLKLNPHRTALPSIFLANVSSLLNKLDELKIWTLTQKRLMDCNIMFFTET